MSYRLQRRLVGASAVLLVIVQAARASPIRCVPGADAGCTAEPHPLGADDCDSDAWIEPLELMVDDSPSGLEAEDTMVATVVAALAGVTVAEGAPNQYSMTQPPERILADIPNSLGPGANVLPSASSTTPTPHDAWTRVADASDPGDPHRSGWVAVVVPDEYVIWIVLPALIVAAVLAIAALTGPSYRRSHRRRRTRV